MADAPQTIPIPAAEPPVFGPAFRSIVEMSDRGVAILDGSLVVLYANPMLGAFVARPPESLVGRPLATVLPDVQARLVADLLREAREKAGGTAQAETTLPAADGPRDVDATLVLAPAAEAATCYVYFRDITRFKRIEAELRKANAFFDNLIDSSPDGIVAADLAGKVVLFNAGARRILGYAEDEPVAGMSVDAFYPARGAREVMRKMRGPDHGGQGKLQRQRVILLPRDGREVPVSLSASIIREGGRETATVGTFRDLRPAERMEKKLEEARVQLFNAEKMASVGKLAAGIAHEINNPLSGILIYANLVLEDLPPDDPHAEDLRSIVQETARCKAIVKDVLEFAREAAFEMHPTDLGQVVETGLRLLIKKAFFRNVHLFKDLDPAAPPVLGDAARLRQVVLNLVINAVEAMKGHGSLTIKTRVHADGQRVRLEIADTGPGIPEEILPRIFDPFFTTKRVGEGTGLGLSVTYGIVKEHHGTIRVESKVGKGTTFLVDLPMASGEEADAPPATGGETNGPPGPGAGTGGDPTQ